MNKKLALLSVYNKDGIVEFAKQLIDLGWTIISSGGTAKHLKDAEVAVTNVAEITGMEPILSHRVLTLHPKIHGGLLALDTPQHLEELSQHEIPWLGLVCCDFYPLEDEIKKSGSTRESVIEQTDIGGPTQVRSGAKGRRIVICDAADRQPVLEWMKNGEPESQTFLDHLAAKAEWMVSRYCGISAHYHSKGEFVSLHGVRYMQCKYGENAWQTPAYVIHQKGNEYPLGITKWKLIGGSEPSYNNWLDVARMIQTMTHIGAGFEKNFKKIPFIALGVKHGNACGAAVGDDDFQVTRDMLMGDALSIHGGMVMLNFPVTLSIAEQLVRFNMQGKRRILDLVAAPSFDEDAVELLSRKEGKCRMIANPAIINAGESMLDTAIRRSYLPGGDWLEQPNYTFVLDLKSDYISISNRFSAEEENKFDAQPYYKDIVLAWAIGSTSNSNTITLVREGKLLGNGVGQQSRVDGAVLAVSRAKNGLYRALGTNMHPDEFKEQLKLNGAVAYSDSFFVDPDAIEVLNKEKVRAILTTLGSVNDEKIIKFCFEKRICLFSLPDIIARGFYGHG